MTCFSLMELFRFPYKMFTGVDIVQFKSHNCWGELGQLCAVVIEQ